MKNKLLIILLFIGFFANAQWLKNIFEYSTPFFSYNETNPLTTDEQLEFEKGKRSINFRHCVLKN